MGGDNFIDLLHERGRGVAGAAVVSKEGPADPRCFQPIVGSSAECDRWRADGSGTAQIFAVSEPPPRAHGEPASLSVGGAEGSGTAQNAAVADPPP